MASPLSCLLSAMFGLIVPVTHYPSVGMAHTLVQQQTQLELTSSPELFPTARLPSTFAVANFKVKEAVADDFTEEERDAARLKGLGFLALGIGPSLWAAVKVGGVGGFGKKDK